MKRNKANTARIEKVLVFYEGPQLLLLKSNHGEFLIGFATEKQGYKYPIICCQMLVRHLNSYLYGKVDVRFLFNAAPNSRIYFADLSKLNIDIVLRKAKIEEINEDVLPEAGLFSRLHTTDINDGGYDDAKQRFSIDGTWKARDFSRFHGRLADGYSLLYIAQNLSDAAPTKIEADFLHSVISEKQWQGGGSYLSFYSAMKHDGVPLHPLRVAGIEYHSLGYMEFAGKQEVLNAVVNAAYVLINDASQAVKLYRAINKVLRSEGISRAAKGVQFSSDRLEDYVKRQTLALAHELSLPNAEWSAPRFAGQAAVGVRH